MLLKAGREPQGVYLTCLRHTFDHRTLKCGMRLECLQSLLDIVSLDVNPRYAGSRTRPGKAEYFRAMAIIERGIPMAMTDAIVRLRVS